MKTQVTELRSVMKEKGVDFYLIPTDDFHASEYVGDYFKTRAYVSGFTGSAGTLLVGADWAGLWTDGRYFLQAADQLRDTGITLMKMGEPEIPTLVEFLGKELSAGMKLGFDGRCVNTQLYLTLKGLAEKKGASVSGEMDLVGEIWTDRPALSACPAFELPLELTGKCRADKIHMVQTVLKEKGADALVLSTLMDICWLLNIRGGDVACIPVVLSYAVVKADQVRLFANPEIFSEEIAANLKADGVEILPYDSVYTYVSKLPCGSTVMLNPSVMNSRLYASVPDGVAILEDVNPTELPKAIKNPTEVTNFREAHVRDGVAVTRFMRWVKETVGQEEMTEISAAEKLETFREAMPDYMGKSFRPIIAWGPHGAIVHYSATPESDAKVENHSFLLCDTGGHYRQGTTDITRTFAVGALTAEEKDAFTLVLKSNLRMGDVKFKYGCSGQNLDIIARQPLWDLGMDFNHGTGHGVGYLLSVHEGPHQLRWNNRTGRKPTVLEPGMIISNEPGLYLEGKFGIRHENLVVVKEGQKTSFGRFLEFETLTMVPFDLDGINAELLDEREKALLNAYHKKVFETLSPRMEAEELAWLANATREI